MRYAEWEALNRMGPAPMSWGERACMAILVGLFVAIASAQAFRAGQRQQQKADRYEQAQAREEGRKAGFQQCMEQF